MENRCIETPIISLCNPISERNKQKQSLYSAESVNFFHFPPSIGTFFEIIHCFAIAPPLRATLSPQLTKTCHFPLWHEM